METKKKNGKAIASLIFSCLAVVSCCTWYFGIVFGITGVVLGIISFRESAAGQGDLAIAGVIVGAVGMMLGIASAVIYILLASAPADSIQTPAASPSAITTPSSSPAPIEFPDEGSGSTMFAVDSMQMRF
ncbi:MAG: DUF4190 domain-containing protein [Eubacterium sp.]